MASDGGAANKELDLQALIDAKEVEKQLKELSFEQGLRLLEELVKRVESGGLALDKAVLSYERGSLLVEHLRSVLSQAEQKLKVLSKN